MIEEFKGVEVDKLIYTLVALHEVTVEIASNSDLLNALTKLLHMIKGTVQTAKGAFLHYAPLKLVLDSVISRGIDHELHWKINKMEVGKMIATDMPLTLPELQAMCPELIARNGADFGKWGFEIAVPLSCRGELQGVLLPGEKLDRSPYSPADRQLLAMLGRQVSVALYNFRLVDDLKKTVDKLRKQRYEIGAMTYGLQDMAQLSNDLATIIDLDQLPQAIVDGACRNISSSKGVLVTIDADHKTCTVKALKNISELKIGDVIPLDNSYFSRTIVLGEMQRGPMEKPLLNISGRFVVTVPIKDKDDVIAILGCFDKERDVNGQFTQTDEAILLTLSSQASTSWMRARYYDQATIDGLTRLYVRRFLEQRLGEETRKAQRQSSFLSVLMLDIDHFKKFNDSYGHQTGDEVIRMVAAQVRQNCRQGIDLPARYGGEELTVVMPDTDTEGAMQLAERIRHGIETMALSGPKGEKLNVTISIGVSTFPQHASSKDELIEKADIALYRSKRGGRNRCSAYVEE
ncbi:MAG: diguanylate cyclase [Candidatus Sericytochromatia bacterium]|nr:diguanylate cyclase [Candidatus Sericytochromatia bacterium]